jgi:hypothetical protein
VAGKAGAWRVDQLGDDGAWTPRAALRVTSDVAPRLACGPAPAERCVVVWRDRGWKLAALDRDHGDRLGAAIALPEREAVTLGVSPDGARVAVGGIADELTVVDLASGHAGAWPGVPGCYHQYVAWSRTGPGLYASLICTRAAGAYQLMHQTSATDKPTIVYRGTAWVSPPALGARDELYVNLRSFDDDFVMIDGL